MNRITVTIANEADAQNIAGELIWLSIHFSVKPTSDGSYQFTIDRTESVSDLIARYR